VNDKRCAFCDAKLRDKRVAFDPARERLWTICGRCGQWNLLPYDASVVGRLEVAFTAANTRGGGTDVGLAELADGTTLVRVGSSWSNFAAWRYGNRFIRRRWRWMILIIASGLFNQLRWERPILASAVWLAIAVAAVAVYAVLALRHKVCLVPLPDGTRAKLRNHHQGHARLRLSGGEWELHVRHDEGESVLTGRDASRVVSVLLARLNYRGGRKFDVTLAIEMIERAGGPDKAFATWLTPEILAKSDGKLWNLPKTLALALEMAAHEEDERRALAGELAVLRLDMRDAEHVARIVEEELA
jgi:hypothetical protein